MIKKLPGSNSKLEEYLPFVNVDFIVSDIDGTLISGSDSVIQQIKTTIKNLKQQKVDLTVATGRTYYGAKTLLQELGIRTGMPVALYNGGIVIEFGTENVLYAKFIGCDEVRGLLQRLPLDYASVYLYTFKVNNNIFKEKDEDSIIEEVYGIGKKNVEYDVNGLRIEWIDVLHIRNLQINAILIDKSGINEEEKNHVVEYLKWNGKLSYTDSGSGFIEIKANGLNKGIIFEKIKNQNKYQVNKILAIGDNDNDQELFQYADISVAVANSSVTAIETADYICENESANGFLDMLNVIKTAKKYCEDKRYK